jgi:predicted nucleic acid-binding protein
LIFILDTNVVSELIKDSPDSRVVDWLEAVSEDQLFLSVLTLGELRRGIDLLAQGRKKNDLLLWFDGVQASFQGQLFSIDDQIAQKWGEIMASHKKLGTHLHVVDGLIAATALMHNAVLVTRNTKDFDSLGLELINPWD